MNPIRTGATLAALVTAWPALAIQLPSGFTDEQVAVVGSPTAMAFTPDGRLLIATQPGKLFVHDGTSLLATPALDLAATLCSNSERGMLGVAIAPDFSSSHAVYVYYTFNKNGMCPRL